MAETEGVRFILKYGVIIIIGIIAVVLLNKFGVFSVFFAPESCNIEDGFDCISFSAHKDGVNLILQNLHDYDVFVANIKYKNCIFRGRTNMPRALARPFLLKNCILNGKLKDVLSIDYYTPDNKLNHIKGSLVVNVK